MRSPEITSQLASKVEKRLVLQEAHKVGDRPEIDALKLFEGSRKVSRTGGTVGLAGVTIPAIKVPKQ